MTFQLSAQENSRSYDLTHCEQLIEQEKYSELIAICNEFLGLNRDSSCTATTLEMEYYRAKAWMKLDSLSLVIDHLRPIKDAPINTSNAYESGWADCMYLLGSAYEYLGDIDSSIYFFEICLNTRKNQLIPDYEKIARTCSYLGYIHCYILINFKEGERFYLEESEMLKKYEASNLLWAMHYLNLAGTYSSRDYQKALNHNANALSYINKIPNNLDFLVTSYNNIANLYFRQKKYRKALGYYSLAQVKLLNEKELESQSPAFLYENMGACYKFLGILDSSEFYYSKAFELNTEEYGVNSMEATESLILLSSSIQNQADARRAMTKAVRRLESNYGRHDLRLKRVYDLTAERFYTDGWADSALYYYNLSLGANRSSQNYLEVPSIYSNAPVHLTTPMNGKANILLAMGMEQDSVECIKSAIEHYKALSELLDDMLVYRSSELERVEYMQSSLLAYEKAVEACFYMYEYDKSSLDDLWFFMEKSRSSVLLLQSAEAKEAEGNQTLAETRRKLKGKRQLLESLIKVNPDRENSIRLELYTINENIDSLSKRLGLIHGFEEVRSQSLRLSSAIDYLDKSEKEGIIQFYQTKKAMYAFAILGESISVKKIEGTELLQLKENVSKMKRVLRYGLDMQNSQSQFKLYTESAYYLYEKLLGEFAIGLKNLIIIPDGCLVDIPFETLIKEEPENKSTVNYRSLAYLIKDIRVSYAYSFSWLSNISNDTDEDSGDFPELMAFAYSDKTDVKGYQKKVSLSASQEEVDIIGKVWPGEFRAFIGQDATEKNFKNNQRENQILHLATHNEVDTSNFLNSGIVFRDLEGTEEDGLFHTYEIGQLAGSNKLVVLSACESGLGDYVEGEGYFSVGRSFAQLGTPFIISSLWRTSDAFSKDIMVSFYSRLVEGMSPPNALRESKLRLLSRSDELSAHPSNWAAFVSMGAIKSDSKTSKIQLKPILFVSIGLILLVVVVKRKKLSSKAKSA